MSIRRSKLICTLGPACDSVDGLKQLIEAGMDVARFNFSHGTHEEHGARLARLRQACAEMNKPVAVLQDLCGPKIRTGKFDAPFELVTGSEIVLREGDGIGNDRFIPITYEGLAGDVRVGDRIMFDDGRITMNVVSIAGDDVTVRITQGGGMRSRVGVHLPTRTMRIGALTEKDKADLGFGLSQGFDYVALSFVRRAEDMTLVREICQEWGTPIPIVSKIETPEAVENLESVIAASDAVMVARGDLGVEMPLEAVPGIQKQITRAARRAGKPVVVATQMLESMISAPVPTRAEVSDVSIAVFEGADAVMLSAESAAGQYPVEAVTMMNAIAEKVETDPLYPGIINAQRSEPEPTGADAISLAARQIGETLRLSAIVTYTSSGTTGLRAARERPALPIIALSPVIATARRLSLVWGCHCVVAPDANDLDDMVDRACRIAHREEFCRPGDRIIITAGVPLRTPGATNMLRIAYVGSDGLTGH